MSLYAGCILPVHGLGWQWEQGKYMHKFTYTYLKNTQNLRICQSCEQNITSSKKSYWINFVQFLDLRTNTILRRVGNRSNYSYLDRFSADAKNAPPNLKHNLPVKIHTAQPRNLRGDV